MSLMKVELIVQMKKIEKNAKQITEVIETCTLNIYIEYHHIRM